MQTLSTTSTTAPAKFTTDLFSDFVEYIDRSAKTTQTYLTNLKQFAAWIRYAAVDQPTRQDIILYRNYLSAEHEAIRLDNTAANGWSYRTDQRGRVLRITCKANTIKQYLQAVRAFFKWTAAEGLYPNVAENVHAPKVSTNTHRKEALTPADVLAIEDAIKTGACKKELKAAEAKKDTAGRIERATEQGKRLYAMYLLAVNAGLRTCELERANVKDLETKNGDAILYIHGKGHSEADQKKPLAPEVFQAIEDYLESRSDRPAGNSPLFVSTGNRSGGQRIAARTISTMLKKAMKAAGYSSERITAHSLRHTAGTNVMQITGNLYTTQTYMRHANPATTEIYLHVNTEKQDAETARKLYAYYHQ